jgi:hypothetical protein
MKAEDIKVGMKIELMSEGKALIFEVRDIMNDRFKIYNKFRTSWYASLDYINEHFISIK